MNSYTRAIYTTYIKNRRSSFLTLSFRNKQSLFSFFLFTVKLTRFFRFFIRNSSRINHDQHGFH